MRKPTTEEKEFILKFFLENFGTAKTRKKNRILPACIMIGVSGLMLFATCHLYATHGLLVCIVMAILGIFLGFFGFTLLGHNPDDVETDKKMERGDYDVHDCVAYSVEDDIQSTKAAGTHMAPHITRMARLHDMAGNDLVLDDGWADFTMTESTYQAWVNDHSLPCILVRIPSSPEDYILLPGVNTGVTP